MVLLKVTDSLWCPHIQLVVCESAAFNFNSAARRDKVRSDGTRQDRNRPGFGTSAARKFGSACGLHCDGLALPNVNIGGAMHTEIVLRKCTSLRCCYGKTPRDNEPLNPRSGLDNYPAYYGISL